MKQAYIHIALLLFGVLIGACQKELPNQPKPNQPPSTRLWLSSSMVLNETSSRQHAHWYGEDPDGYIKGYLIATPESLFTVSSAFPDTFSYSWTTKNDSIISLPLLVKHSVFTIIARAIDNTFQEDKILPEGARIRLMPRPYWDVNNNGLFDSGDKEIPSLFGSIDTKSASQLLPIRNTPPKVFFAVNPIDSATIQQPESTFTVATFSWYGTDVDGDQTISSYRIALNDTSTPDRWFSVSGTVNLITLMVPRSVSDAAAGEAEADVYTGKFPNMQLRGKMTGLRLNANNVLYLQARDVAGEFSTTTTMPSTPNVRKWYVKKPKSKMLVVSDMLMTSTQLINERNNALRIYSESLENAFPSTSYGSFDVLDVGIGMAADEKQNQLTKQKYGSYVPGFMNPQLIQTLKLFDIVFWVSDLYPSYLPAQIGLFNYSQTGGKVIFSTTFPANVIYADLKALNDFAPIDSVSTDVSFTISSIPSNADGRVPAGTKILSMVNGFPELAFDSTVTNHIFNWRRIYKRTDANYIYQIDSSKFYSVTPRYLGRPNIGVIDNDKKFVLVALPLHRLNGRAKNLPLFFKHVIQNEFGLN